MSKHTACVIALFIFLAHPGSATAQTFTSWSAAKNAADDQVYYDHRQTLYCGCPYESHADNDGSGDIALDQCNYASPAKHSHRAGRVEWEHIVPVSLMPVRQFECWKQGGREECEKNDPSAQRMIFDLHNIAPSIGQVNAFRSNDRYGIIDNENRDFGGCEIEDENGLFEPADDTRGDVARVWLYMVKQHHVLVTEDEWQMFLHWHFDDPVSSWEKTRNTRIREIQGNGNPYVE